MNYVTPHLIQAHAQLISAPSLGYTGTSSGAASGSSGGGARRGTAGSYAVPTYGGTSARRAASSGSQANMEESDYKILGTSIFERPMGDDGKPDPYAQWDEGNGGRWIRKWLPGEKEAEAQQRIGNVKNQQAMELATFQQGLREDYEKKRLDDMEYRYTAQQKREIDGINSALEDARKSGRFSPAEFAQLEKEAFAKRAGIKPLPTPKEKPSEPQFHTDEQGNRWINNGNKWESVDAMLSKQREQKENPQDVSRRKYMEGLLKEQVVADPEDPDSGKRFLTEDEMNERMKRYDSFFGTQRGPAQQTADQQAAQAQNVQQQQTAEQADAKPEWMRKLRWDVPQNPTPSTSQDAQQINPTDPASVQQNNLPQPPEPPSPPAPPVTKE